MYGDSTFITTHIPPPREYPKPKYLRKSIPGFIVEVEEQVEGGSPPHLVP